MYSPAHQYVQGPLVPRETLQRSGELEIDLTGFFNGIADNYLDTLHSDYAFVVAPWLVKGLNHLVALDSIPPNSEWDFQVYPNPTRDEFFLRFQEGGRKSIALLDLSGRVMRLWSNLTGTLNHFTTEGLAPGAYCVRATDGVKSATKQLLVH